MPGRAFEPRAPRMSEMAYFNPVRSPEELIALAWMLEEGSCKFYGQMGKEAKNPEAAALFRELSDDEEKHKSSLFKIYQRRAGKDSGPGFPHSLLSLESGSRLSGGGDRFEESP